MAICASHHTTRDFLPQVLETAAPPRELDDLTSFGSRYMVEVKNNKIRLATVDAG
jgi:hypothetical protein